MVESIGTRPVSSETKISRIAAAKPPQAVGPSPALQGDTTALGGVAKTLASKPPIDVDRVALVRRAIERGDFPILPATIADRMIALRYDWMSADDQA
jgi:negative regulator of flagellin synthesis FlgM